ncbi:uncharacterized protein LOC117103472 [Anneissia japonica]|uniref:uncharacterized protein LOC117103472 n=1 Tax=Anneissia japonica TaxID=1529436 RepID=UPI0014257715|nr:uncharacterized protein LOC117103472 [Anneissia japonica]
MAKFWRKLDKEGILAEPLVRYLWENQLTASEDDDDDIKDFIELMKAFGLLFEKNASEEDGRLFVVPSRMKTKPNNRLEIRKDDEQTVSIYVTPKDFLPDAVYDVLVVRFVSLSQDRGRRDDPKLFQNKAEIIFDDKHYVRLGRIYIDNKQSLKLEISRMKERDAYGVDKPTCKPHPGVCTEVLKVLKQNLDEVYPSKKVVGYELNILCSVCVNPEKPHFQELEYCLKNEYIHCYKTGEHIAMSTANVQNLFKADCSVVPVQSTPLITCDKTGQQMAMETDNAHGQCAKGTRDFQVMLTQVSKWYDKHELTNMLKLLYKDKVSIAGDLLRSTTTLDLFKLLYRNGSLQPTDLKIIIDTIVVTNTRGIVVQKVSDILCKAFHETNVTSFSIHRQKLIKLGRVLLPHEVKMLGGVYDLPKEQYKDQWTLILNLEMRREINENRMSPFIQVLKDIGLNHVATELDHEEECM